MSALRARQFKSLRGVVIAIGAIGMKNQNSWFSHVSTLLM